MTTKELADHASHAARSPTLVEAQSAVRTFLKEALPDVHRVDITKVMPVEFNERGWEADAVVWQPNATIAALGLSTQRPVLDQNFYVVRLDDRLNVIAYEIKETERAS
ncbi:MAG: hypothetical protein ACLQNE_03460 [Thermoguttaceae bacterium]